MKLSPSRRRAQAGFTLLEIMLVVAIIVLLLGAAIYKMRPQVNAAKEARARADIQSLLTPLMLYETTNGFPPSTSQGLGALVNKPTGEPKPRAWSQLMESVPADPWGKPYQYERPGKHNTRTFDIYTAGADGQPGTADDIGNWENE